MTLINKKIFIAAAAATAVAVAAAFDRQGLVVPYAEDHFPDMASMRYDRSPYYRAIERAADSATIVFPRDWAGKRIVVGVGYPSDTFALPSLTINGRPAREGIRPLRWEVSGYSDEADPSSVTLRGLGKRPVRVYAYATPRRVWVDDYHIVSALDSADMGTGVFEVDIRLGGIRKPDPSVAVEYMLFDATRHQVAAGRADAAPHLRFRARIPGIHRWSTDDPFRYMLAIILRDDRTGRHIMTAGSPMRFANYTAREGEGPVLNGVSMAPLALARLDSVPASPDARATLAGQLRAAGANAVISPEGYDPDTDWRNVCADRGILCYADGALDPLVLFAADPALAERPQLPGGFDRMAARYARVTTELADTATLTIAATTRSPFASLDDFALDYEFVTPLGRRLTSGEGVVTSGNPRERTLITLFPHLPGQKSALPDDMPEAYLNLSWRPLRPMAGADPRVAAETQYVIGRPASLSEGKPQKIKRKKDGLWKAKGVEMTIIPATGLLASLSIDGRELLQGPVGVTIDGMAASATVTDLRYDSHERAVVARIDLDNPSTRMPVGHAVIAYTVNADRTVDITVSDATPGTSLAFRSSGDRVYLGRGPGDAPASSASPARIALYQARAGMTGAPQAHADTRHLTLMPSPAAPEAAALHIALGRPAETSFAPLHTGVSAEAGLIRLSPLRQ